MVDGNSADGTNEGGTGESTGPALPLSAEDKEVLLRLVRQTVLGHLGAGDIEMLELGSPALQQGGAAFVTWRTRLTGELRGCIGECVARRPLVESVARMAVASAMEDPRFPPVTIDELNNLSVEISALTPMIPIKPDDVVVGRHGLMIRLGHRSGLLLPQVPVEQGWSREEFLAGVCWKAGLPEDAWAAEGVELLGFEAEVWGEEG